MTARLVMALPIGATLVLAVALVGCYPGASEATRMDMVRRQAVHDLGCPADELNVVREVGFTYRTEGCGRKSVHEVVCSEGQCRAHSSLVSSPGPVGLPPGVTGGERIIRPGAVGEMLPPPTQTRIVSRAYAATFRVCVSETGLVESVEVVRSTGDPALDGSWKERLHSWRFQPHRREGKPIPLCRVHELRLEPPSGPPVDTLEPEPRSAEF